MATLKQIRQRIKTAKNIRQITKAMKLVAAARLKKATDRVLEARPYSDKLREVMLSLGEAGDLPSHPLMESREVKNYCLILITSERGLCGGYNTNLIKKAQEFLRNTPGNARVLALGRKGSGFFTRQGAKVFKSLPMDASGVKLADANDIANTTRELFETGEVDAIYICYSKYYSPIRQTPQVVQLLPIAAPVSTEKDSGAGSKSFIFEPGPAELLGQLLPRYFFTLIWQSILEATASEHGARMTAMTSATDNAGKMIDSLTLTANRERQAAITKQIMEIVGGAEALKG